MTSRIQSLMIVLMGINISFEVLLPVPFVSFLLDAFFIERIGWKRMYEILLIDTIIFFFFKLNVFIYAGAMIGDWLYPFYVLIFLPPAVVVEIFLVKAYRWIFVRIFPGIYRRLNQI